MLTPPPLLEAVRRRIRTHRRPLAALLAAVAVMLAVDAARPDPAATQAVVVAAADLKSGHTLTDGDLVVREIAVEAVPGHAVTEMADASGRVLAAPMRAGAALTDLAVLGPALLDGYSEDTSLVAVEPTDPSSVPPLRVGDVVDVVGTDPRGVEAPRVLARRVQVAATPADSEESPSGLVVAADRDDASLLAGAGVRWHVAVTVVR